VRWVESERLRIVYFRLTPPGASYLRRRVELSPSLPVSDGNAWRVRGVRSFTPPGQLLVSEMAFEGGAQIVYERALDPGVWHLGVGADPEFSEHMLTPESSWAYQGEPMRFCRVDWGLVLSASALQMEYRATSSRPAWLRLALFLEPAPSSRVAKPSTEDELITLAEAMPDERETLLEASVQLRSLRTVGKELQRELAEVLARGVAQDATAAELAARILRNTSLVPDTIRRSYTELDALTTVKEP
jgi:hypothetical protein